MKTILMAGMALLSGAAPIQARDSAETRYVSLECDNIRRLSDNYLLDLRIRLVFDQDRHRYLRYENAGRGWQAVGTYPFVALSPTRVTLDSNEFVSAYIERLTGDFYYIDRSNTTLSIWGRCDHVGYLSPLF